MGEVQKYLSGVELRQDDAVDMQDKADDQESADVDD